MTDTNNVSFTDSEGNVREFPKRRGRPVMDEVFFYDPYDPYERWVVIDLESDPYPYQDDRGWSNEYI